MKLTTILGHTKGNETKCPRGTRVEYTKRLLRACLCVSPFHTCCVAASISVDFGDREVNAPS